MSRHLPDCAGDDHCDGNCLYDGEPRRDVRTDAIDKMTELIAVAVHSDQSYTPSGIQQASQAFRQRVERIVDDIIEAARRRVTDGYGQTWRDPDQRLPEWENIVVATHPYSPSYAGIDPAKQVCEYSYGPGMICGKPKDAHSQPVPTDPAPPH